MILEPDDYLYLQDGTYLHTKERSSSAWLSVYTELKKALKARIFDKVILVTGLPASGKSTWVKMHNEEWVIYIVDADLVGKELRKEVIQQIREHDSNIPIGIVFLDTNKKVCLERNAKRSVDRVIPLSAYADMTSVFSYPSTEEGFFHIHFKWNFSV